MRLFRVAPRGAEVIGNFVQGVAPARCDEPLRGGPRPQITHQMFQVPLRDHFERRRLNVGKGEGECFEFFDQLALRRPEGTDHLVIVPIYNCIDRWFDVQQVVSRCSEDAVKLQRASCFFIKPWQVESVQCLRDHDQIDRLRFDAAVFCRRDTIFDALVLVRLRDLFFTCIGREHAIEQ